MASVKGLSAFAKEESGRFREAFEFFQNFAEASSLGGLMNLVCGGIYGGFTN